MNFFNQKKVKHLAGAFLATSALSIPTFIQAQTLTSNQTGTHNGFYYTFWKDTGNVSFGLHEGGRYTSQWDNSINNWVGGKGWNPGGAKVVNYSGTYNIDSSQNSYLALYGWTKSPLVEYYVIESYGSYNPSSCSGGQDFGSFQSDGATYNIRRCQRVNQPSIEGTSTFYQYFSVRTPKKGFGNISGTITVANHFNAWASAGLNLGSHDYMVLATEGYQSSGSSDITVSEGAGGTTTGGGGTPTTTNTSSASSSDIIVRARGTAGGEHINLIIGDSVVADWTITTSFANYSYSGNVAGDIAVEFDNDGGDRDVILDYVFVNGETRQAEDMEYNTATYDGECGGGSYSETMHCGGMIGFGDTGDCFSGNCNASNSPTSSTSNSGSTSTTSSNTSTTTQNNTSCSGYVGITFDDGPMSSTSNLINTLKQNNLTPVTWFNTGQNASSNSYMMAQQLSVGEVQNHSYSHPHMSGYSYSQVYDELNRANQAIQSAGAPKPTLYRPPYGETNSTIEQAASALGLRVITWDVDSQDWNGASASAIANAASQLQNGQVILMHDGQANTATAIAQIASGLRSRGLCPGRIDPSSGRAVAPSNTTTSNTATTTNTNTGSQQNSTSGSNQISVVAKGVNGDESITLSVGGTSVQTWTLSTGYQTYSASTNASGDIEVEFTNDADGRDVQIDYITINGETRQAEDMEYNTGAYDGECGGGSYSEMLHCSGAIGFGGTNDNFGGSTNTSTTSAPTTTVTPTAVTTNTSGQCQCNWYGSSYAVCGNQSSGWGWENNASCIGTDTCNGQSGSGGVVCN